MDRLINRRSFIGTVGSVAAAAFSINTVGIRKNGRKPNLLFLWTDQQRPDTMRVYGNTRIHTPNLNKLADESVVFLNPYVSQPVCTPSRSTVMTGLWPHTSGCTANNIPLPASIPCFPEILNDPDYRTGYFGKWHLGDEIFAQHGFQEWGSTEDGYSTHYRQGRDKHARSAYHHFLLSLGYKPDKTGDGVFSRGFAVRLPIEHCKPKFLEGKAVDFLARHRNDPFILYVNFLEPHSPVYGPLNEEHRPEDVDLPPNLNDPLEADEPLRYRLAQEKAEGKESQDESKWRRLIARYWGMVTQVDRSVGAILKTLEDLGLDENTIVVYTSDHGNMLGAHRLMGKTVMYQESVRIPWMMRIPVFGRSQRLVRHPVGHIHMVPTLLDLMGRPMEGRFPGRSLLPLVRDGRPAEDRVFIEWNPANKKKKNVREQDEESGVPKGAPDASIRTVIMPDGWKLCLSDGDKSQLFDLKNDPWETTNLFYKNDYRHKAEALRREIHRWQETVKDTVTV